MKRIIAAFYFIFCNCFFFDHSALAFSDQTTTERILRENRQFIEFINKGVTNFAREREKDLLEVYELHFNADVAYLQSDYKRAYKRIYSSQEKMEKLYMDMLSNYYLEDSKNILDAFAPGIIRSKNARARLYLTLGYRDRTVSWTHYTVGINSNPRLHSYRLYKFVEGIKMARRAKRYGFLALFESQKPEAKQGIYNQLVKSETARGNPFYQRFVDLAEKDLISEMNKPFYDFSPSSAVDGVDSEKETRPFERQLLKRVRFRSEKRTARYMMNREFDKAEDIMRQYIDDFNFKLIMATFDYLNAQKNSAEGAVSNADIDYNKMKIHLQDNYQRLSGESVLESFKDKVAVEDDIQKKKEAEEKDLDRGKESEELKKDKTEEQSEAPSVPEEAAEKK